VLLQVRERVATDDLFPSLFLKRVDALVAGGVEALSGARRGLAHRVGLGVVQVLVRAHRSGRPPGLRGSSSIGDGGEGERGEEK
jgi:hypothetical protein